MHPASPILLADRFAPLRAELLKLLRGLSADDWQRPTPCEGWTVQDVAAHLLDSDLRRLALQRDGLPPLAPDRPIRNNDDLIAFLDDLNAAWVQAAHRLSPRLLIDLLAWTGPQISELMQNLDPYAPAMFSVAWAGEQTTQNWFDIAREYTEKWHHQQHIRQAVAAPLLSQRPWLYPVLDTFLRAAPYTWRHTDAAPHSTVVIHLSGEAGGHWTLRKEDTGWALYQGEDKSPTAGVTLPATIAWQLFSKGFPPAAARAQAQITGDPTLVMPLFKMVSIMA